MYHWNIKFQEKIFTCKKVIQLWNFGNFGISEIIPKTLVTLRFLKVSLHELESNCKCFQMRYWPIFYVHPTYNNTHFSTRPGVCVIICPPLYNMSTVFCVQNTTVKTTVKHYRKDKKNENVQFFNDWTVIALLTVKKHSKDI